MFNHTAEGDHNGPTLFFFITFSTRTARHMPITAACVRPTSSLMRIMGNPGPVCGRALLREFEMKRERKPIFVEWRPNNQEFNIRFALVSGKPLLPAENRRMLELAHA